MKKKKLILLIIMLLLFSGCVKTSIAALTFELDNDGNYSGFKNLPTNYTAEQAVKDNCYVLDMNTETVYGEKSWTDFITDSTNGEDTSVRIVSIYEDQVYFNDLFYVDGSYRIFDSSSEDLQDYRFKYLLTLEGKLSNAAKSGTVVILTDDKELTYDDIMWHYLSSTIKPISPFKLVMLK